MSTTADRATAWACELPREAVEDEYRPFPDVARRNAWQERCEVPALVRLLGLPKGRRVLEVGCGRGVALPVLSDELGPSRLAGIDVDASLVAEAAARLLRKARVADLYVADVRAMPFPAGAFDLVVDFGTCYHVARGGAALREIARVLAPDGLFVHETRVSQLLSHPVRARGRRLPWHAAPELVTGRHAVLWAARRKTRATAVACALVVALAAGPSAMAQEAPPAPPVAPAVAASTPQAVEPEPGPTRLFFAPTARSLPRGKVTVGVTEIAFPWFEGALGNRVNLLGAALPPLEGLVSGGIVVAPKLQLVRSSRFEAAAGVIQAFGSGQTGGVAYGVVTAGDAHAAVTVGCGYGYGQWADSGGSRAVVFLGLDKSLGRTFGLVLEGWIGGAALGLPDETLVGALRVGGRRWSADLGVLVPVYESGGGTPFPVLTIARRF
jgi:SAM-dependent methyltransferase